MQICDAPDATGHLFPPFFLRLDVGREWRGGDETEWPRERPQARRRFLQHPAVCWDKEEEGGGVPQRPNL